MGTFDQLGKKIGLRALGPSGPTTAQHEIASNARQADLRHEPDPARHEERSRLGLLGRLAGSLCLIEMFSSAPGEEKVIDCLGKLIAFRQERRREDEASGEAPDREAEPTPPFVKPFLWIIAAGRPTTALMLLAAEPAAGWPEGVYLTPSRALDPPQPGGLLRTGIIVAAELPRDRSTLLVRIMAGGAALPAALADLAALPLDAHERSVASMDVLELRRALGGKLDRTEEEEEFIMSTQSIMEELREEGRLEGRREGWREGEAGGAARALLATLRVRRIAVTDADRARILAERDADRLERWVERAVVAASLAEVLDEAS